MIALGVVACVLTDMPCCAALSQEDEEKDKAPKATLDTDDDEEDEKDEL